MLKIKAKSEKAVALYTPYLDTLGGGELHVLSILKVLEERGYKVYIFWDKDLSGEIKRVFNLQFSNLNFLQNIFKRKNAIKKALFLNQFDIFIYVTDGSYFFSTAKKNFVFCMVPKKNLYPNSLIAKLKLVNWRFIANSRFTASYVSKWIGKKVEVVYPYVLDDAFVKKKGIKEKEDIILSVGRFFKHLHSKKQEEIILLFKKLQQRYAQLKKIKLVLAGRLKQEDKLYFEELKKLADSEKNILLFKNLSRQRILDLYSRARFYWHFTGYGIKNPKPWEVEHFGISILEAMASGCIVFAFRSGGPSEIIDDGKTGFLFSDFEELEQKYLKVFQNRRLQEEISFNARKYVRKNFSYNSFKRRVLKVFEE